MSATEALTGFYRPNAIPQFLLKHEQGMRTICLGDAWQALNFFADATIDLLTKGTRTQVREAASAIAQVIEKGEVSILLAPQLEVFARTLAMAAERTCPSNAPMLLREPGVQSVLKLLACGTPFTRGAVTPYIKRVCASGVSPESLFDDLIQFGLISQGWVDEGQTVHELTGNGYNFAEWQDIYRQVGP